LPGGPFFRNWADGDKRYLVWTSDTFLDDLHIVFKLIDKHTSQVISSGFLSYMQEAVCIIHQIFCAENVLAIGHKFFEHFISAISNFKYKSRTAQ
jgi:hypothetical protein